MEHLRHCILQVNTICSERDPEDPRKIEEIYDAFEATPGVIIKNDNLNFDYPMPLTAHERNEVFVGRIREDNTIENGLNMWIVADNLRKGAAINAVQIAEYLINNKLV